jgi:eukaryotic-like serine/threonine-protein kinase
VPLDPEDTLVAAVAEVPRTIAQRYRVLRSLGGGAQKQVWLVHDVALDRQCALSLLASGTGDADDLTRFKREARAMAKLGAHPNVVTVHDIGTHEGRPFVVCEYVAGGDLRAELRAAGGRLSVGRAVAVMRDVLSALEFAHDQGVVHRDVKPANIWLTADGRAKLGDFGMARAADWSQLTQVGAVLGTPSYMAPEQVRGEVATASADLYALGCVLHELLAGEPPFDAQEVLGVLYKHVHVPPPPVGSVNAQVPRSLERLVLRLLAKEPSERPASARVARAELDDAPAATGEAIVEVAADAGSPLLGRSAELTALRTALDAARAGRFGLRLLVGESGIGKSRLAHEVLRDARARGMKTLTGTCVDEEGATPFLAWGEVLRPLLRSTDGQADISMFRSSLECLSPSPGVVPAVLASTGADRYAAFHAVSETLNVVARASGLVLLIEDLHWADRPSLSLLAHLVRSLDGAKVLILGTYRDTDVDRKHPLAETLAELRRSRAVERVQLRGLSTEDARPLAAALGAVSPQLVDDILRESEGNPFFIEELVRHVSEAGAAAVLQNGIPEGIRDVVGRRLSRLSDDCNRMLTMASVIGLSFEWSVLRVASEQPEERLLDLLDEALGAQVIRERSDAGRYEFSHALIRQTLRDELSRPRRARCHRVIAQALERVHGGNLERHRAEIASHYVQAGSREDVLAAVPHALRAAEIAEAMLATEDAGATIDAVLEGLSLVGGEKRAEAELLIAQGHARLQLGAVSEGHELCRRAMHLADSLGDAELFARAALAFASLFTFGLVVAENIEVLSHALAKLPTTDSAVRARVMARLAAAQQPAREFRAPITLAHEAIAMARRCDEPRTLLQVLRTGLSAMVDLAPVQEREPLNREMLALSLTMHERGAELRARIRLVFDCMERLQLDEADAHVRVCEDIAKRSGHPSYAWNACTLRAMTELLYGRFTQAAALREESLAWGAKVGDWNCNHSNTMQALWACAMTDDWEGMQVARDRALALLAGAPMWTSWVTFVYQTLRQRRGHRADVEQLRQHAPNVTDIAGSAENGAIVVDGLSVVSSMEELERGLRTLQGNVGHLLAAGPTMMYVDAPYARAVALLHERLGRPDEADNFAQQAIECVDRHGLLAHQVDLRIEHAARLLSRTSPGGRTRAHALLDRAGELARHVSFPHWHGRIEALLA